jgi:uncharacterized membrane protein
MVFFTAMWIQARDEAGTAKKRGICTMSERVQSGVSENSIGALAYFTLIPALLFLAIAPYNRSAYVRFHAWQSIAFSVGVFFVNFLIGEALAMTGMVNPVAALAVKGAIGLGFFLVWLWCVLSALNGKHFELPAIGAWAEKQANR